MIEFGVLGPLTVYRDSRPVILNATMLRTLLALLLHRPGQPLAVDSIMDALWPGRPPATARKTLQAYISRLRRVLGDEDRIRHCPGGYTIVVAPGELDITRFRALIDAGRDASRRGELAAADINHTEALALWRGRPFAELDMAYVFDKEVRLLEEQWLSAHEARAAVRLDLRRHHDVIADLAGLLTAHPYQERMVAYLMLALYRSGRQSEALDLHRRIRKRLAEDLGIEPNPTLSWLQQAILRTDSRLWQMPAADLDEVDRLTGSPNTPAGPAGPSAPATPPAGAVPAQLPLDVAGFTGRAGPLAALDVLLDRATHATDRQPNAVVISTLSGTAGVGKTALAVHWAHRVRDRFPDGQLYIDLRGFDPSGAAVTPAEAIHRFLDALDVPPQRIPADPEAQVNLYRTLLAGKNMLVVLDNARDPEQVHPLLPGASDCLVLVTSRNRLTGLIATVGARPLLLELLTVGESRDLLTRRLGRARVTAEPHAVDQLISHCARLPLALAIVAANAATHPQIPLATLADQLRDSRDRIDELSTSDAPATDLRAVFSWSYRALGQDSARLFRLLGLHPGPDISAEASASLAALSTEQVRPLLNELASAHLITEHGPGRYTFHDLLRAYAADLAHSTEPDEERHAATGRLLDHYLHTAYPAAQLLQPGRDPITLAPARPGTTPECPADHQQALDWFAAEHAVLLALIDHTAEIGLNTHTWQLVWTVREFLDRQGHWHRWVATQRAAVAAAERLADPTMQALTRRHLANAYTRLGNFDEAHLQLRHALDLSTRAGDVIEQANALQNLSHVYDRQSRYDEALDHNQRALDLYRAAGHQRGQARCLNGIGWCHTRLGDHEQALATCRQALVLLQELGDDQAVAATWDSLGYAHHHLGHHDEAITCYEHALDIVRDLGDRYYEAAALTHIGDTHRAAGDPGAAREAWQHALTILDLLQHGDAGQLRSKLADLDLAAPQQQQSHQSESLEHRTTVEVRPGT